MKIKIAVPTRNNVVDDHFGHCESYTLFMINAEMGIESTETLPSPQGCGCKSNIIPILKEKGVTVMLAGNMGNGALNLLYENGITVYRGCSGNIKEVVNLFLQGAIADSGKSCEHHDEEEGHECSHHH